MMNMLRTVVAVAGLAAIISMGATAPASAQQMGPCGYWSDGVFISTPCQQQPPPSQCGYWNQYGAWVATSCEQPFVEPEQQAVSGTIVGINNNILTLQVSPTRVIRVNDRPALEQGLTGHIFTGRDVTIYGYWRGGTFMATSIE